MELLLLLSDQNSLYTAWEFCRGLLEKEVESSSAKYQISHLCLQCEILGLETGGEWRLGLAELGENSDVSLAFTPMCCFTGYHCSLEENLLLFAIQLCAVMDHTKPLLGITESHSYLHCILDRKSVV